MSSEVHKREAGRGGRLADYLPLMVIVGLALLAATARQMPVANPDAMRWMHDFMVFFLVIFSMFKFFDLSGFADGFQMYDLLAGRWRGYAFLYPFIALAFVASARAADPTPLPVIVASLAPKDLEDFEDCPPQVRSLIEKALDLTTRKLGYQYHSADPANGGMDCSGTIYFLLREAGIGDVPRTASDQYVWARKAGGFEAVVSRSKDSFELDALKPGDLMFWSGTYSTDRDPPVTHSMIYLGRLRSDGRQVMFGASDGRTFGGKKMFGVSVFDFRIPQPPVSDGSGSVFVGYALIPGLEESMQ